MDIEQLKLLLEAAATAGVGASDLVTIFLIAHYGVAVITTLAILATLYSVVLLITKTVQRAHVHEANSKACKFLRDAQDDYTDSLKRLVDLHKTICPDSTLSIEYDPVEAAKSRYYCLSVLRELADSYGNWHKAK